MHAMMHDTKATVFTRRLHCSIRGGVATIVLLASTVSSIGRHGFNQVSGNCTAEKAHHGRRSLSSLKGQIKDSARQHTTNTHGHAKEIGAREAVST
jgi:hypothetical protein